MSDNTIQYSMKEPKGGILVIGGANVDAFCANFATMFGDNALAGVIGEFTERVTNIDPTSTAVQNLSQAGMLAPTQPAQPAATSPLSAAPQCSHGDRVWVEKQAGVKADGSPQKAFAGWFCGGTQEQQKTGKCAPMWK